MQTIKQPVRADSGDALFQQLADTATLHRNLTAARLYEEIIRRREGVISQFGAMIVDTGEFTGRAAKDKAIVREPSSAESVWWGEVNKDFSPEKFNAAAKWIDPFTHHADAISKPPGSGLARASAARGSSRDNDVVALTIKASLAHLLF